MLKPHDPKWNGNYISYRNCHALTGYHYFPLLRLTGHTGIEEQHRLVWHSIEGRYPEKIKLKTKCWGAVELRRILNIASLSLRNDLFKGRGLGRQVFEAQLHHAKNMGVKTLRVAAYRDPIKPHWDGYRIWPWYGYTMIPASRIAFQKFLNDHALPDMTIHDLYKLKPDPSHPHLINGGYDLWKRKGDTWHGIFDLADGSENFKLFQEFSGKKS